jgi:hypothetical protein
MSNLFLLSDAQMARLQPFFPKSIRRSENSRNRPVVTAAFVP